MTAAELRALIAKATPGPWEATQDNGYFKVCRDSGDGETHECVLSTFSLREEDSQAADADLIIFLRNNAERFAELLAAEEAAVVASGATTEPVSDPYKLHWAWYGNDHVYLTAELEIVGVVHLPQSGNCIEYPWRCGSVVGTALCIGDARAAVEAAVRAGR